MAMALSTSTALALPMDLARIPEAVTRDLVSYIAEFLTFHDFPRAAAALHEERYQKRPACVAGMTGGGSTSIGKGRRDNLKADMVRYFDEGKRDAFLSAWQQFVPASLLNFDLTTQKLEFNLHVYFSIYPVLPSSSVLVVKGTGDRTFSAGGLGGTVSGARQQDLAQRLAVLKTYLETRGAALAHSGEFLAYYALPFVVSPEHHPSYEHLFLPEWASNLRLAIKRYLDAVPSSSEVPRLYIMYEAYHSATDAEPRMSPRSLSSRQGTRRRSSRHASRLAPSPLHHQQQQQQQQQQQLTQALVAEASEMQQSPERAPQSSGSREQSAGGSSAAVRGERCGEEGAAGTVGRGSRIPARPILKPRASVVASVALASQLMPAASLVDELDGMDAVLMSTVNMNGDEAASMAATAAHALAGPEAGLGGVDPDLDPDPDPFAVDEGILMYHGGMLAPLDYTRVVEEIFAGARAMAAAETCGLASRLLQALRWRLVRSRTGMDRWGVLTNWIEVDLMRCFEPQTGTQLSTLQAVCLSANAQLLEEGARLANVIASDVMGRSYLLHQGLHVLTVPALMAMLKAGAAQHHQWQLEQQQQEAAASLELRSGGGGGSGGGRRLQPSPPPPRPPPSPIASGLQPSSAIKARSSSETTAAGETDGGAAAATSSPDTGLPVAGRCLSVPRHRTSSKSRLLLNNSSAREASAVTAGSRDDEVAARDGVLLRESLVALHKLSLRRQAQSLMILEGLMHWLVDFLLKDLSSLSEFTVEYGCALLMNLSLRSAGRAAIAAAGPAPLAADGAAAGSAAAEEFPSSELAGDGGGAGEGGGSQFPSSGHAGGGLMSQLLRLCENLVESSNDQIRTYVNGMLYSVLAHPAVREEAVRRGLPILLQAVALHSPEVFASQIQHILERIDGEAEQRPATAIARGDESDDADGEEGDAFYNDEDAFADVEMAPETLDPDSDALQGEPLLCSRYLAGTEEAQQQAQQHLRSSRVAAAAVEASSTSLVVSSTAALAARFRASAAVGASQLGCGLAASFRTSAAIGASQVAQAVVESSSYAVGASMSFNEEAEAAAQELSRSIDGPVGAASLMREDLWSPQGVAALLGNSVAKSVVSVAGVHSRASAAGSGQGDRAWTVGGTALIASLEESDSEEPPEEASARHGADGYASSAAAGAAVRAPETEAAAVRASAADTDGASGSTAGPSSVGTSAAGPTSLSRPVTPLVPHTLLATQVTRMSTSQAPDVVDEWEAQAVVDEEAAIPEEMIVAAEQSPPGVVDEVLTDVVDEVPTDVVEELPADIADELLTGVAEELPTDVAEELPTDAAEASHAQEPQGRVPVFVRDDVEDPHPSAALASVGKPQSAAGRDWPASAEKPGSAARNCPPAYVENPGSAAGRSIPARDPAGHSARKQRTRMASDKTGANNGLLPEITGSKVVLRSHGKGGR